MRPLRVGVAVAAVPLLLVMLLAPSWAPPGAAAGDAPVATVVSAEAIEYWHRRDGSDPARPDGRASISEVHTRELFHRGAHVYAVAFPSGRLLLTKRSSRMLAFPGGFNLVGEHHAPAASPGRFETDEECAARAFQEELGWRLPADRFFNLWRDGGRVREYDRPSGRGRRDRMNLSDVVLVISDDEVLAGLGAGPGHAALTADPPPIPAGGAPGGGRRGKVAPPPTFVPAADGAWRFDPAEVDSVALAPLAWVFRWLTAGDPAGMCNADVSRFVLEGLVGLCRATVGLPTSPLTIAAGHQAETLCGEARRFPGPFLFP